MSCHVVVRQARLASSSFLPRWRRRTKILWFYIPVCRIIDAETFISNTNIVLLPHVPISSQKKSCDIFLPLSSPPSPLRPALPLDPLSLSLSLSLPSSAPASACWRASPNPSARTMITGRRVAVVMFISSIPASTDVILSLGRQSMQVTRTVSRRMRP